jgi:isopentenyl-diphosphate Delta-isomerase
VAWRWGAGASPTWIEDSGPPIPPVTSDAPDDQLVVLLDTAGRPVGTMPKAQAHHADTPLHLAFSVYVFDAGGRFLATRRALGKRTWPGVWTNSCCGHPAPGEGVATAARRRLGQELGLQPARLELVLPDFAYRAVAPDGTVEHEVCPVLFAHLAGDREPEVAADPDEVAEWRWVSWETFGTVATTAPWALSPWSVEQVTRLRPGR